MLVPTDKLSAVRCTTQASFRCSTSASGFSNSLLRYSITSREYTLLHVFACTLFFSIKRHGGIERSKYPFTLLNPIRYGTALIKLRDAPQSWVRRAVTSANHGVANAEGATDGDNILFIHFRFHSAKERETFRSTTAFANFSLPAI